VRRLRVSPARPHLRAISPVLVGSVHLHLAARCALIRDLATAISLNPATLTNEDEWIRWFEAAWEHREEVVYRQLFGEPEGQGIYVLKPAVFEHRFGTRGIDPRWLHHGVFVYPPIDRSGSWKYVTSGLSNAWEADMPDPDDISGLGTEFLFETNIRYQWAIGQVQEILAFELLLASGAFEGRSLLDNYDRIPLHGSIEPGGSSHLTHIMIGPSRYPRQYLPSGSFIFQQLVGISESEAVFARMHDGEALQTLLMANGAFPVTDPARCAVV
jgi:Suppressor of fused protein (SUFU)